MRKLYWTIKIISALVGLVFLTNMVVPNWRDLLGQGVSSAVKWVSAETPTAVHWGQQEASKIQKQVNQAGASPHATPAPGSHSSRPTPQPISFRPMTPGASPAPSDVQGPPPAAPMAQAPQGWSYAECTTMVTDMVWDAQLDSNEANRDTSTNPAQSAYYATWSAHWQTVADYLHAGPCAATPAPLSGSACTDPPQWFQTAITSHQIDEASHPQNKAWDDQWTQIYQTIAALWPAAGC